MIIDDHQGAFLSSQMGTAVEPPHLWKSVGVSTASYLSAYERSTFM